MKPTPTRPETDAIARELHLDRLLGRQVLASNYQRVGRVEEFRTERQGRNWAIVEYVIGGAGLLERLGVAVRLLLGRRTHGYVARWDQLDISEPERPRLKCRLDELRRL
jgi:hypothetical protein